MKNRLKRLLEKNLAALCLTVCPVFIIDRAGSVFAGLEPHSLYHQDHPCRGAALVLAA
jgi:hypothetical protein